MKRSCWLGEAVGSHRGFTLVELLVVITIIGILVALLLPAINSAQSARKLQCANNLKQMGMASMQYIAKHNIYPTGGWGWCWVGDPDRGYDHRQPGGWVYNLLPFMEQTALHDLGKGLMNSDGSPTAAKMAAALQVIQTPLSYMNCPTRRRAGLERCTGSWPHNATYVQNILAAQGDYAICAGSRGSLPPDSSTASSDGLSIYACNEVGGGPSSLQAGDSWPICSAPSSCSSSPTCWQPPGACNGVSFERSEVKPAQVRGGTSNTLLIGEKGLDPNRYFSGIDSAENENVYVGFDNDNYRVTGPALPMRQDRPGVDPFANFGSAHPVGANFVFCDGSVHAISYAITPDVWLWVGSRTKYWKTQGKYVPIDMTQVYSY